ncbi:DUF2115 domain-containing protein [Methanoculleus chikugoensis]|uniref:DUF2115 family protein n=1 Tax=Methanoculleus chikugoensis TaxID=118126 RepID=UPI001FB4D3C8|nr:DUF2115 family protein [Methanoculleus chikugoensis]
MRHGGGGLHREGSGEGPEVSLPEVPPLRVHDVCHGRARPPGRHPPVSRRQIVDEWEGAYLCPVRDKADDVAFALCPPYCPAVQSTEPTFPEMRARRHERRRRESLANYWTNYKDECDLTDWR